MHQFLEQELRYHQQRLTPEEEVPRAADGTGEPGLTARVGPLAAKVLGRDEIVLW